MKISKYESDEKLLKKNWRVLKAMIACTSIQTGMLVAIIFQMVFYHNYSTLLLWTISIISYGQAFTMFGILAKKFLSWYVSKQDSIVLLYGISAIVLCVNLVSALSLITLTVVSKPNTVTPHVGTIYMTFTQDSNLGISNSIYVVTSILSFILLWLATTLLLRHHAEKLGKLRLWIMLCVPLGYFLSQFFSIFFSLYGLAFKADPILFSSVFTLLNTYSKPVGGILFGIAFYITASKIKEGKLLKDYLIISGSAIVLFFIANQAIIILSTPYPPFGLVSVSFLGFASFLFLTGIFYSATSVSVDAELRRSIRTIALRDSRLLNDIGTAELETRIIRNAQQIQSKLDKEEDVESSYDEIDLQKYVTEVLNELTRDK